jgi:ABC-type lipoprotein export system ATPase subunit
VSLLSVEGVSKRYRRGNREFVALRDVSLSVAPGELFVVLGTRRSGRSTLLRVASGIERPDDGRVLFDGADPARDWRALGRQLSFCHTSFSALEGERMIDHVAAPLLAHGRSRSDARHAAEAALERAGAVQCATMAPYELDGSECVRVGIARALAPDPRLIVVDDPTAQAGVLKRDPILRLLRSLAGKDGAAVLMSTDDAMCVSGADEVLQLDAGEVRPKDNSPEGEVVHLSARRIGA